MTCATCYGYLFPPTDGKELRVYKQWLVSVNGTIFPNLHMLLADANNETFREQICRTLNNDECARWTSCCQKADMCCQEQLSMPSTPEEEAQPYCPRTWDGFSCWSDTAANSEVSTSCPSFLKHAVPSSM